MTATAQRFFSAAREGFSALRAALASKGISDAESLTALLRGRRRRVRQNGRIGADAARELLDEASHTDARVELLDIAFRELVLTFGRHAFDPPDTIGTQRTHGARPQRVPSRIEHGPCVIDSRYLLRL